MIRRILQFVALAIIVVVSGLLAFWLTPADPISHLIGWAAIAGFGVGAYFLGSKFGRTDKG